MAGQNPISLTAKTPAGFPAYQSLDTNGNLYTAQGHGDYFLESNAGRLFKGANQAGATLSAGLATTYVGLCLSNPAASGKNLVLQRVSGQIIVAPAAVLSLGLIGGYLAAGITTHTTPITALSPGKLGASVITPVAKLDAACTLVGTPFWYDWFWANTASAGLGGFAQDLKGDIILEPGSYVAIGANVAGPTAGFLGSFEWEEVVPSGV